MIDYPKEIAAANYPEIRLFLIPRRMSFTPQDNLVAAWELCQPETVKNFSAVAYVFAEQIHKKLGVPVGIIQQAYAGTPIEGWMPWEIQVDDSRAQAHRAEITEAAQRQITRQGKTVEISSVDVTQSQSAVVPSYQGNLQNSVDHYGAEKICVVLKY